MAIDADPGPGGLALALPLIALAGWVDALGLVQWHGLNPSFMSGNSIALGAAPTGGDWHGAWDVGRAVLVFVAGAVVGELIGPAARDWRRPAVMGVEAACLWLAFAAERGGWGLPATAAATGLAMGLQTAVVHRVDGAGIALTYVTGTLVSFGRGVAAALRPGAASCPPRAAGRRSSRGRAREASWRGPRRATRSSPRPGPPRPPPS